MNDFTQNIIINTLDQLSIDFNPHRINREWMSVRCPLHNDKNLGNAAINLKSGIISCFSCKQNISIIKLYMQRKNCSYKEACEQIFNTPVFFQSQKKKDISQKRQQSNISVTYDDFFTLPLNPEKYHYTKIRGFSKSFCEKFDVRHCVSGNYLDYMLIPIIDSKKKINIVEARKLMQREYILKYYSNTNFDRIKCTPEEYFKIDCKANDWRLNKEWKIKDNKDRIFENNSLKYLLSPKVLYPSSSDVHFTLWNIDNVKRNQEIWISEGLGSAPKIYDHISENYTCTFGSKITEEQIEYLLTFKNKIIILPDNDEASYKMIEFLNKYLTNLWVADIMVEDTDEEFVTQLQNCPIIPANEYLLKKYYFQKKSC